jgi:hypothetical protein
MPLVGFKPTKARLVIEQGNATVLVMRIVPARDERVMLTSGGSLQSLTGVLRIREHGEKRGAKASRATGTLVYIPDTGKSTEASPAKFQVNITMSAEKFDMLVRLATAGRLPAKFFVDVSGRVGPLGGRAFGYISRGGRQVKLWDTTRHRLLTVTAFTMILPVDMPDTPADSWEEPEERAPAGSAPATNSQVAELADDLLVFQSETKHMLNGIVIAIVVICLLIGAVNLVFLFR